MGSQSIHAHMAGGGGGGAESTQRNSLLIYVTYSCFVTSGQAGSRTNADVQLRVDLHEKKDIIAAWLCLNVRKPAQQQHLILLANTL